jgi:hypothetical protein
MGLYLLMGVPLLCHFSLIAAEVFNVSLHVPSLRMDEMLRVIRSLDVFALADLPAAVNALKDHYGNTVPIKRLLLWLELAKQVCGGWVGGVLCCSNLQGSSRENDPQW